MRKEGDTGVRAAFIPGLGHPSVETYKADELKPPGPSKSAGLSKPGKNVAKVGSSTRAKVAKKKSARKATISAEPK